MGCGSSTAVPTEPVKPAPKNTPVINIAVATAPSHTLHHVTEAELAARGFGGNGTDYLGMRTVFYAMPKETEEEKRLAVATLANGGAGPVAHDEMDAVFTQAKQIFKDLDKDRSGALELAELEPLCVWLFDLFARGFSSDEEKAAAVEQQLNRFRKNGPPSGSWTFKQFEEYYRAKVEEAEQYQLKRNEAYAKGYDESAAAAKFKELDADGSQFLTGAELEKLAEWVLTALSPTDDPISSEVLATEAVHLVKFLDGTRGNNDGKISFAEFDGYFQEKIREIEKFEENASIRQRRREEKSAEKIQACARGKQGRDKVAKKRAESAASADAMATNGGTEPAAAPTQVE